MRVVLGLGPWQNGKTCRSKRWGTRGQHFCCSTPSPGIISVTVNDRKSESEHVKVAYRSVRASNESENESESFTWSRGDLWFEFSTWHSSSASWDLNQCADAVIQHVDDDEDEEGEVDDVDEDEGHLIGGDSRAAQVWSQARWGAHGHGLWLEVIYKYK